MILRVPKHLTDLNIVLQMHLMTKEYSENYYEDQSDLEYLYQKDLNFDYVREFIEITCPDKDKYTIDYLTSLFYKLKGCREIFDQIENHLGIRFIEKPRYQIDYLLYKIDYVNTNRIDGYFTAFKNFLRSLLYFMNDGSDTESELLPPDIDHSKYVFTNSDGEEIMSIENRTGSSFSGDIGIISTKDGLPHGYEVAFTPDWVKVDITDEGIRYSVTENTSESPRSGVIYLQQDDSDKVIVITVYQPGIGGGGGPDVPPGPPKPPGEIKYVFTDSLGNTSVRNDSHSNSSNGFTDSAQIISTKNGSFTEFTVSSNSDWLTPNIDGSKVTYTATENTSESPRIGILTAIQKDTGKIITITVVQGGTDPTIVIPDPDNYIFTDKNGSTEIKDNDHAQSPDGFEGRVDGIISTKNGEEVGYTASTDSDWIHVRIDDNGNVIYTTDKNEDEFPRTGVITLVQDESGKTITITVTQGGKGGSESNRYTFTDINRNTNATDDRNKENNKSFSNKMVMISNKDGVKLIGFSVSCDSDWLTVTNDDHMIYYTAEENKSESPRVATITAIQNESGKVYILKVTQGEYIEDEGLDNLVHLVDLINFTVDDELLCMSDIGSIMYKEYSFNYDERDQY